MASSSSATAIGSNSDTRNWSLAVGLDHGHADGNAYSRSAIIMDLEVAQQ